jgi:hypothetical protein
MAGVWVGEGQEYMGGGRFDTRGNVKDNGIEIIMLSHTRFFVFLYVTLRFGYHEVHESWIW